MGWGLLAGFLGLMIGAHIGWQARGEVDGDTVDQVLSKWATRAAFENFSRQDRSTGE